MGGWTAEEYCYVTTTGRRSGRPHTIEIWFAAHGDTLYILAGSGESADWVRNLRARPEVMLRVGDREGPAVAAVVEDEGERRLARAMVPRKYRTREEGLEGWAQTALPVAVRFADR